MCKVYGYCRVSTRKQSLKRQEEAIKELYPGAIIITDSTTGRNFDRPGWTKLYKQLQPGDTIVFDEVSRMSRDAEEGFEIYQELFQKGINLIFIAEPHINTETYKKAMETGVPMTGTNVDFILEGVNKYLLSLAKEQIRLAFEKSQSEVDNNSRRTSKALKTKKERNEELKILHPDDYQDQPDFRQIGQRKGAKLTTKKEIALKRLIKQHNKDFQGNLSDVETIALINGMTEIKNEDGTILSPHIGETKKGNQLNKFLNRGTFYKYKRELKQEIN